MSSDLNEDIPDNNFKWTNLCDKPKVLVGRDALTIPNESQYILRKPIKYGYFNTEYHHQSVLDDITKIVEYCLINVLQINKKTYGNFQVVLLIPDLFIKTQVKSLVNVFLKSFSFKAIFLHLESVMSSFGAALQSACVLDIGADKISVCCVDEGIILEDSIIRRNFGCDDLTKFFYLLLKRKNVKNYFPCEQICLNKKIYKNNIVNNNINQSYHYRIIEKLKEAECEFPNLQNPTAQFIPKNCKIWLQRKNFATKMFNITLSEAAYLTPLALLNADLFESIRKVKVPAIGFFNDIYGEMYPDPEDTYEELILNLNSENAGNVNVSGNNQSASKGRKWQSGRANAVSGNYVNANNENMEEDGDDYDENNNNHINNKSRDEDEEMQAEDNNCGIFFSFFKLKLFFTTEIFIL